MKSLQWRHNDRDSVSNHQPHDCLLNRLFSRRSMKTSKLRVTDLCAGWPVNFPHKGTVTREYFHLMTSSCACSSYIHLYSKNCAHGLCVMICCGCLYYSKSLHCHRNNSTALISRFMGPTWGPSGADKTQVGPMLAPWTLLSGWLCFGYINGISIYGFHHIRQGCLSGIETDIGLLWYKGIDNEVDG